MMNQQRAIFKPNNPPMQQQQEPSDDDEDKPISALQSSGRANTSQQQQQQPQPPTARAAFKAPRSSNEAAAAASSSSYGRSTIASSSSASAPALHSRSSALSLIPSRHCPLHFYPPSYRRAFPAPLPITLPVSTAPEVTTLPPLAVGEPAVTSTAVFSSPHTYSEYFTRVLCQEMQGRINKVADAFTRVVAGLEQRKRAQMQASVTPNWIGVPLGEADLQNACRQQGVFYYSSESIELTSFGGGSDWKKKGGQKRKGRGKKGRMEEDEEQPEEEEESVSKGSLTHFLQLKDRSAKEGRSSFGGSSSGYAEGDLWLISSSPQFDMGGPLQVGKLDPLADAWFPAPRSRQFNLFVCSDWHSFAAGNQRLRVSALPLHAGSSNSEALKSMRDKSHKIYALRLGNFSNEMTMMAALNNINRLTAAEGELMQLKSTPLLPLLLHGKHHARFKDRYHPRDGWMSDKERLSNQQRTMQSLKQSKLLLTADGLKPTKPTAGPASASSSASAAVEPAISFTPLTDPVANLLPSVVISRSLIRKIKENVLAQFPLNADQLSVLNSTAGWFWTEAEADDAEAETSEEDGGAASASVGVQPPTSSPIQLVHGCFGSGKSYLLIVLITFLVRLLDIADPQCKIKILVAGLTNVAGQRQST